MTSAELTARVQRLVVSHPRTVRIALAVLLLCLIALLALAMLPVGWAKGRVEQRLSAHFGAPVTIGSLAREPLFSFTPTIVARDIRVAQPAWAGSGSLLGARTLRLRVSLLPMLIGRGLHPRGIEAEGLTLALVRRADRRSNWEGQRKGGGGGGSAALNDLVIRDGRFTLRDERRQLRLAGTISADARGLLVEGEGQFHEAPARLSLRGGVIAGLGSDRPYPIALDLESPLLRLSAKGSTVGALNLRDMALDMTARAPSLKYLDDVIEAGLFGTQPIDMAAKVRHRGKDWFVDRIAGTVGRSRMTGDASILKRDGRSKIDARIDFAQFDFDDLADGSGRAQNAAIEARIGPRVLPNTRINLAKVGPTDGQIRFTARQLLFNGPSVFRSLKGVVRLEGKVLTLDNVEAGLTNGRMTGRMVVDHRQGAAPLLTLDLVFRDGRLGPLLMAADKVDAPFQARLAFTGRGNTIREALAHADGHAGLAASSGHVIRIAAAVLAQDMGKTIGAALHDMDETVPLRCIALGFEARGGVLTAAPFLIETELARSRGTGTISLADETIALAIGGRARDPSGLAIMDPIMIGGTLSAPSLQLASLSGKKTVGSLLGAVAKSIGGALGLEKQKGPQVIGTGPIDCRALSAHVLRR